MLVDGRLVIYWQISFAKFIQLTIAMEVDIIKKYRELPQTKDVRNFMRIFLSGATTLEFDKQGRINIPSPLIEFANLKKDCIIIGVNDRLEIWSCENWNDFITTNEDNFSDIADNLFASNINF